MMIHEKVNFYMISSELTSFHRYLLPEVATTVTTPSTNTNRIHLSFHQRLFTKPDEK